MVNCNYAVTMKTNTVMAITRLNQFWHPPSCVNSNTRYSPCGMRNYVVRCLPRTLFTFYINVPLCQHSCAFIHRESSRHALTMTSMCAVRHMHTRTENTSCFVLFWFCTPIYSTTWMKSCVLVLFQHNWVIFFIHITVELGTYWSVLLCTQQQLLHTSSPRLC